MKKKKNSSLTPARSKAWYYKPIKWLNVSLVLLSFLSLLAPFTDPKLFWPLALLGLITPLFLALHLLFFLFWTYRKHWYAFLSLGILIMSWSSVKGLVGFQVALNSEEPENELKVVTYNVHLMTHSTKRHRIPPKNFTKILEEIQPDVLCLQEFLPGEKHLASYLEAMKAAGLKYQIRNTKEKSALLIASRFPLKEIQQHRFDNYANGFQVAELSHINKKIHIYNTHLRSNYVTGLTNDLADNGNLQEKETWRNIRQVAALYKRAALRRSEQAEVLAEYIKKSKVPSIICGDLNDVVQSYTYKVLKGKHQDAFLEGGRSWGASYAGKIPGLRIDYIFADPSIRVIKSFREPAYFSDHHPVSALLQVP